MRRRPRRTSANRSLAVALSGARLACTCPAGKSRHGCHRKRAQVRTLCPTVARNGRPPSLLVMPEMARRDGIRRSSGKKDDKAPDVRDVHGESLTRALGPLK